MSVCCTSPLVCAQRGMHTLNFYILSGLDASAVRPNAVSRVPSSVVVGREGATGAVLLGSRGFDLRCVSCASNIKGDYGGSLGGLLTLKATGSECGFFRRRVCDTSC